VNRPFHVLLCCCGVRERTHPTFQAPLVIRDVGILSQAPHVERCTVVVHGERIAVCRWRQSKARQAKLRIWSSRRTHSVHHSRLADCGGRPARPVLRSPGPRWAADQVAAPPNVAVNDWPRTPKRSLGTEHLSLVLVLALSA
jgi:hypothetical protein